MKIGNRLSGEIDFFNLLNIGPGLRGDVVGNTIEEDYVVDTVYAGDTGLYETGVRDHNLNNGAWIIVDEYKTREEAAEGHKLWIEEMKKKPKKLFDIHEREWIK